MSHCRSNASVVVLAVAVITAPGCARDDESHRALSWAPTTATVARTSEVPKTDTESSLATESVTPRPAVPSFAEIPAPLVPTAVGGVPVVIDSVPTVERVVALTFDSNMTDEMLDRLDSGEVPSYDNIEVVTELQRLDVPATFFLAGKWVERYPESTRRIGSDERFEIGSHSYAHLAFAAPCWHRRMPTDEMAADVDRSFKVLRDVGVVPVPFFRFPGLCHDASALRAIAETGVVVIGGAGSGDAFNDDRVAIQWQVLTTVRPGAIIVFHITKANAPVTAEVIAPIVAGLRADGYHLVRVSDLLASRQ